MSEDSGSRTGTGSQEIAPLLCAIERFISEEPAYFRIPAHRFSRGVDGGLSALLGEKVFCSDLTEAEGLDDLHAASGAIAEAEELAASLWGSEECHFLVNGSTCGNEAMLLACLRPGEKVLLARNVHRSVLAGLVLSGAHPLWMQPEILSEKGPDGPVTAETVRRSLKEHPDCRAVLLVSPTYYGICSPLKEIAAVCHENHIPLLVDEAHGSHLYFLDGAPAGALASGADLVVQSLHKTGGSMTQSSLLHVQGALIDRNRLRQSLAMVMSTSPSYVLMASLDGARRQLALYGRELMRKARRLADLCREKMEQTEGVNVLKAACSDPLRIVFSAADSGISGTDLQKALFRLDRISLELSDPSYAVAVVTWGNTEEDIERLVSAVRRAAEESRRGAGEDRSRVQTASLCSFPLAVPETVCRPRDAWYAESEAVRTEEAAGRIAAESLIPYPPGIPVLYPGERVTEEICSFLCRIRGEHVSVHGAEDRGLMTVRVLKRDMR